MARPNEKTPISEMIHVVDATQAWTETLKAALGAELGTAHQALAELTAASDAVAAAHDDFTRERAEDQAVLIDRQTLITDAADHLRRIQAATRRRLRPVAGGDRILASFRFNTIARLTDTDNATSLLNHVTATLKAYRTVLDGDVPRADAWIAANDDLVGRIAANANAKAREQGETSRSLRARNAARLSLVDLLRDLADAATSLEDPAPLDDLLLIYKAHLSEPTSRNTADDPGEDPTAPESTADAPEPTP